jgi:serine/threonine protein phosphatase PrpC
MSRPPPKSAPEFSDVAFATHPGRVRSENEDAVMARRDLGLFVVADGMGGHQQGDRASSLLVDKLGALASPSSPETMLEAVASAVSSAHRELRGISIRERLVLGTTMVALLVHGPDYAVLWAGDSRAYRLRGRTLEQLTRDHSEVQELVASGVLTPEQARTWPRRHVVTRAVGSDSEPTLELSHGAIEAGDVFLLCTDGLTEHCTDADIAPLLTAPPSQACSALVELTLDRGGSDNVTVLIVRCGPDPMARTQIRLPGGRPA